MKSRTRAREGGRWERRVTARVPASSIRAGLPAGEMVRRVDWTSDGPGVERFDDGDFAAIGQDGGFAGRAHEEGIQRTARFGDERNVLAYVLIHLDGDGDGHRGGSGFQGDGLRAAVIEDAKIGKLQAVKEAALPGENECRESYQADRDADGGYLLRGQEGK